MPKKLIKKYLPDPELIKNNKALAVFGKFLHDHNLWHLNRRSARSAFAVGTFAALMPMPFQTVLAIALAIFFRGNIPIAFALCWLTNPFTMAPIFYLCYNVGALILGRPAQHIVFHANVEWLLASIGPVGESFLVGSFVVAIGSAAFLFFAVDGLWRLSVMLAWKKRQRRQEKLK